MKTELEMAKEGEVLREYGKVHFLAVSEAVDIGRFKWNMVPIGKKGQGDIVFYLTTEQMLALCTEILNGTFAKKIAADTGNYPGAYKYVTGEDGYLRLNIGGGKMGCRVQMQDARAKTNYTMAIAVDAIYTMARKYMLYTGMTPVVHGTYYASIVAAFEEGRAERSKFRKPNVEDLGDVINENSVIDETVEDELKITNESVAAPAPVSKEPEKKKEEPAPVISEHSLVVHGAKNLVKGFYVFEGADENGNKISLMFRKEEAEKLSWFEKFENTAALGDTPLKIMGEKRDNYILYKGPIKK